MMEEGEFGPVMFANNNPGHVTDELFNSFVTAMIHDFNTNRYIGGFTTLKSGGLLSIYRNKVVESFLRDTQCEWLWFVDSDIQLDNETLPRMMEHADPDKVPILGALYYMAQGGTALPTILMKKLFPDGTYKVAPVFTGWEDWPHDKLLKTDAVGLGCTLIHRTVFEKMKVEYDGPEPWFAQEIEDGVLMGEDISFCRRAVKLGYNTHVHTGIEVGHVKPVVLTSDYLKTRKLVDDGLVQVPQHR